MKKITILAGLLAVAAIAPAQVIIYETGFETADGFTVGPIDNQSGWTTFDAAELAPIISTANPFGGSQHLRLPDDPNVANGTLNGGFSPDWGPTGHSYIETSVMVAISAIDGADYDVVAQAPSQSLLTYRVKFSFLGDILILDDVGAGLAFQDTGVDWNVGPYTELRVVTDFANNSIDYYYGGSQIYSSVAGVFAATDVEQVILLSDSWHITDLGDFDDLSVQGVPEPASMIALGAGLAALAARRRKN